MYSFQEMWESAGELSDCKSFHTHPQPTKHCRKEGKERSALLVVLYDTAAQVQELLDLVVGDIHLKAPSVVRLRGKGNKQRQVPPVEKTAQ